MEAEIKNAIIENVNLSIDDGFLNSWITLDYGGYCQGFGGWSLYLPKTYNHHNKESFAGHFIYRVMEIAQVSSWDRLKGKTVRAKADHNKVHAIGHIVKDDWFNPYEDMK